MNNQQYKIMINILILLFLQLDVAFASGKVQIEVSQVTLANKKFNVAIELGKSSTGELTSIRVKYDDEGFEVKERLLEDLGVVDLMTAKIYTISSKPIANTNSLNSLIFEFDISNSPKGLKRKSSYIINYKNYYIRNIYEQLKSGQWRKVSTIEHFENDESEK